MLLQNPTPLHGWLALAQQYRLQLVLVGVVVGYEQRSFPLLLQVRS